MSREEFYSLNPKTFVRYKAFYTERYKRTKLDADEAGWIAGQYVAKAIAVNFSNKARYPRRPSIYTVNRGAYEPDREENNRFVDTEESKPMTAAEEFEAWALAFNKAKFNVNPE